MISDFAQSNPPSQFFADICIIGAGAAGISIAREFITRSTSIILLESGSFDYDELTQDLYAGSSNYQDLTNSRLRYFGGTTNHYVGESSPLDEIDFQVRDWVPHSGWPFGKQELEPYYKRAQNLMDLGPYAYDESVWEMLGITPHGFDERKFKTYFVQYSGHIKEGYWDWEGPVRFGSAYRAELKAAENINVLLNANAIDIRPDQSSNSINNVAIQSLSGNQATIHAKVFVIACGGIETPRLMLNSQSASPAGVGNNHDLVGRYFASHPYANIGSLLAKNPQQISELYSRFKKLGPAKTRAALRLSEQIQKKEEALNISVYLVGEDDMSSGVGAATEVWRQIKAWNFDKPFATQVWSVLTDLDEVGAQFLRARRGKDVIIPAKPLIGLWAICEWAPYPESRVKLREERDALGLHRAHVDDRVGELELHTFKTAAYAVGVELARLGLGRVHLDPWITAHDNSWKDAITMGGAHHYGTTRMAESPRLGVVDKNCKVHNLSNLFIASSSVFPTNGYSNPTVSIVALSLRLADHLKSRFVT